jgi:hypothetical protein
MVEKRSGYRRGEVFPEWCPVDGDADVVESARKVTDRTVAEP